ncbi:protein of unknown function, putative transposase [Tepidibacter aestuarii]|nr:protein of unknown function, putative transposase [Tepidibacter aestuarii]
MQSLKNITRIINQVRKLKYKLKHYEKGMGGFDWKILIAIYVQYKKHETLHD